MDHTITLILQTFGSIIVIGLTWYLKKLAADVKSLDNRTRHVEIDLPKNYVSKKEYQEDIRELKSIIREGFTEVFHKIDTKVDKE